MRTVGDLLVEFKEKPPPDQAPPVLTLTERNGFVPQAERFNKRLATEDTSSYKVVRRNDIAFNPYLLWAGAVAQNTIVDAGVISPLYPTFHVREGHDPRYVARLLLTPEMIGAYDTIAFGSVPRRRRSSVTDFLALPLASVPPLDEQRRIAAILDHADALRAKRRQILAHLDAVSASLVLTAGRRDTPRVALGDLIVDGPKNGLYRPLSDYGSGTRIVRIDSFKFGSPNLTSSSLRRLRATPKDREEYGLRPGDLLVNRVNSKKHVGKTALVQHLDEVTLFESNMMRLRLDESRVSPAFVAAFMQTRDVRAQIAPMTKDAVNQSSINQKDVRSILVPLLAMSEQQFFETQLQAVASQRVLTQSALDTDDEMFASLQARAFRGEL